MYGRPGMLRRVLVGKRRRYMQQVFFEVIIMTVMIRDKKTGKWPFEGMFSEDAKRRAREYFESCGHQIGLMPKFDPPADAVSASRQASLGNYYAPWEYTTEKDMQRNRCEKRRQRRKYLRHERESGITRLRRAYVWVFYCPGISGIFEGWWTYIIGPGFEHGGKFCEDSDLILRAMELFPVVEPALIDVKEDWKQRERWMIEFAKRYQRGCRGGKPQGKAPIWGEVKGNRIERILGRAQWPKHKEKNENINTRTR